MILYLKVFFVGGLICSIVQIIIDTTKLTPARILTSLIVIGSFLSAVGLYQPIVDFAEAGATVPLSGFGHILIKGTQQAIEEKGYIGILTGGLSGASGGIAAAIIFGFIFSLFSKAKPE